ncbi:MAG: GGDEF domain-containing protein [Deltaproteobacteria bacterium]|nr:GGDEF domain-containing protein [Deltaproteobacteria bacterium]
MIRLRSWQIPSSAGCRWTRRAGLDQLTGLHNRRVFEDRIAGMIESSRRYKRPLTIITMDLDRFKQINDNLGHQMGDEALKLVARARSAVVRQTWRRAWAGMNFWPFWKTLTRRAPAIWQNGSVQQSMA